jgi:hypothetical protein
LLGLCSQTDLDKALEKAKMYAEPVSDAEDS